MSERNMDPAGSGAHPPAPQDSGEMEERELDIVNPEFISLDKLATTTDGEADNASSESEKGQQPPGTGPPQHAGFWHHDMVNIRLHVLKLWARTGKLERQLDCSHGLNEI